jgi:hypothetical protein
MIKKTPMATEILPPAIVLDSFIINILLLQIRIKPEHTCLNITKTINGTVEQNFDLDMDQYQYNTHIQTQYSSNTNTIPTKITNICI